MAKTVEPFGKAPGYAHVLGWLLLVSNVSQLPQLLDVPFVRVSVLLAWSVFAVNLLLVNRKRRIPKLILAALFVLGVFDMCVLLSSLLSGRDYYASSLFYPAHIVVALLCVGVWVSQDQKLATMVRVCGAYYIVGAGIVGVSLYFGDFKGVNWADSMGYVYSSKNSVAPILLSALILCLVLGVPKSRIARIVMVGIFSAMVLMLKSRATIVGGLVALLYAAATMPRRPVMRIAAVVSLGGVILLLLTIPTSYDFLVNKILLNNRAVMSADDISSGRLSMFDLFGPLFSESPLLGNGPVYLESFPLASLATFGLVGALPLFSLVSLPAIAGRAAIGQSEHLQLVGRTVMLLWIAMTVNGLFEEMSPLGPGIKTAALWVVAGLCIGATEDIARSRIAPASRVKEMPQSRPRVFWRSREVLRND
jgi:O-Antigen ligase